MSARELIREVADALDPEVPRPAYDGEGNAQRAAALRALADRLDAEQLRYSPNFPVKHPQQTRDRVIALELLARLDADLAPPAAPPPRCQDDDHHADCPAGCPAPPAAPSPTYIPPPDKVTVPLSINDVRLPAPPPCASCGGSGTEVIDGAAIGPCPDCAGAPRNPEKPCATCGGKRRVLSPLDSGGEVITDPCPSCTPTR